MCENYNEKSHDPDRKITRNAYVLLLFSHIIERLFGNNFFRITLDHGWNIFASAVVSDHPGSDI